MERLTKRQKNGDATWNRGPDVSRPGYTPSRICEALCKYEDAEEQGKLAIFPFALGEHVWCVFHNDFYWTYSNLEIVSLTVSKDTEDEPLAIGKDSDYRIKIYKDGFVYKTEEEAKTKLKELENEYGTINI